MFLIVLTTQTEPTTTGAYNGLNCFGYVIYMLPPSINQNIAKLLTHYSSVCWILIKNFICSSSRNYFFKNFIFQIAENNIFLHVFVPMGFSNGFFLFTPWINIIKVIPNGYFLLRCLQNNRLARHQKRLSSFVSEVKLSANVELREIFIHLFIYLFFGGVFYYLFYFLIF